MAILGRGFDGVAECSDLEIREEAFRAWTSGTLGSLLGSAATLESQIPADRGEGHGGGSRLTTEPH
jgi:hypothetical protein